MILAHLPSGYLVGRAFGARRGAVLCAALAGSVLPDLDMIWFYGVDRGRVHHHYYWVHIPAFWAAIAVIVLPVIAKAGSPTSLRAGLAFFAAILVHLLLDSIGGGIMWLWPADNRLYSLIDVPPAHGHWILSFLLHWSFLTELALIAAALFLFLRPMKAPVP